MVTLADLWLPILLSAVIVFVASSIIHMVLRYHRSDYKGLPNEEAVRSALGAGIAPAMYLVPWCPDMKEMKGEAMQKKFQAGPVALITVRRAGMISMGPLLGQWFLFCILISLLSGYVAEIGLVRTAPYMLVFRCVAIASFLGYAGASISAGIWSSRPWSVTFKDLIDGAIYGMLTAGTFGWLWPH